MKILKMFTSRKLTQMYVNPFPLRRIRFSSSSYLKTPGMLLPATPESSHNPLHYLHAHAPGLLPLNLIRANNIWMEGRLGGKGGGRGGRPWPSAALGLEGHVREALQEAGRHLPLLARADQRPQLLASRRVVCRRRGVACHLSGAHQQVAGRKPPPPQNCCPPHRANVSAR